MRIIGLIRKDDVAACGATVLEGSEFDTSMGRQVALKGARMSCAKNCVIAEGVEWMTINGIQQVVHGMKTTCGCPLISTLNDEDGISNESGAQIPIRYVQENGQWVGKTNEGFDQHFLLLDEVTEAPLAFRRYAIECDGKIFEGRSDAEGKTELIATNDPANAKITVFPEGA